MLVLLTSCSKNFDYEKVISVSPPTTAKIEGKHAIYISEQKFPHNKNIVSEDCESWALKLEFNEPLKTSLKKLLQKMFEDYTFVDKKIEKSEIEKKGFVSQVSFYDFKGVSKFKTERNSGKYDITLKIKIKVENSSMNITNEILSNMNWEKNVFFNCNLQAGAVNSSQKALEILIKKIYETTYESLFQIKK
tara:strand:- start:188 stop:760 length:573 start_codon:yes stop_codon:yes gene_type:complete